MRPEGMVLTTQLIQNILRPYTESVAQVLVCVAGHDQTLATQNFENFTLQ